VAGIALSLFDALLLEKNPFEQSENNWVDRRVHQLRHLVYTAASMVNDVVRKAFAEIERFRRVITLAETRFKTLFPVTQIA
jgi:hypothetical protein